MVYLKKQMSRSLAVYHQSTFSNFKLADQETTHRYNPTADIFIQNDFSPKQNKHTAIPEWLSLWKRHKNILDNETDKLKL